MLIIDGHAHIYSDDDRCDNPHSAALLEQYGRGHTIRGLRSYQAANGRLDHPGVARLWEAARRLGIVVNVRVNRDKTAEPAALLGRFPDLKVVLDHCLYIAAGPECERTLKDVLDLARHPKLCAKLSFLGETAHHLGHFWQGGRVTRHLRKSE